jgi:hypothetical protein
MKLLLRQEAIAIFRCYLLRVQSLGGQQHEHPHFFHRRIGDAIKGKQLVVDTAEALKEMEK